MRPLAQRYRPMDLTFMTMLLALLLLVPAALAETDQWQAGPQLAPALGWVLALGIGGSFAGTLLWNMSLEHLRASTVAPFVFLQPLAGVLGDYFVHGRSISQAALLGGGFIAAGVLLVILPARRRSAIADA
jgi:drug/metabolite transporter (DMT)-like permease